MDKEVVIKEILWTNTARKTFDEIVSYLQNKWSEKDVENFINQVSQMLSLLQRYPEMCRPSIKREYVRIGIVNKHTQIVYYYKPDRKQIEILLFWNMKQNPVRFKY